MIPLLQARIDPAAAGLVTETLASGYVNVGERVAAFERELAEYLGAPEVLCVNSCTSALVLALRLAHAEGRRVVTTPMTFVATTTAIYQAGATPAWADVASKSCQIDATAVRDFLWREPAAVMAVAWSGDLPDLRGLCAACDEHHNNAVLILDAAQGIGATFDGKPLHELADFTCYSFSPTKHLSTGDGGALVCRDPGMRERARKLSWFGMRRSTQGTERVPSDQPIRAWGYKFNMNEIAASIGLANLRSLPTTIARCRQIAARYDGSRWCEPKIRGSHRRLVLGACPWFYTLFVDVVPRFIAHAAEHGVEVKQPHRRNDVYSFAAGSRGGALPNTDFAQAHYIALPCGWWMSDDDVERVIEMVRTYPGEVL